MLILSINIIIIINTSPAVTNTAPSTTGISDIHTSTLSFFFNIIYESIAVMIGFVHLTN